MRATKGVLTTKRRSVIAAGPTFTDDFNRANGSLSDVDHPYVVRLANNSVNSVYMEVNGNKAYNRYGAAWVNYAVPFESLNQYAQLSFDLNPATLYSVGVRMNTSGGTGLSGYFADFYPEYVSNAGAAQHFTITRKTNGADVILYRGDRITPTLSTPATLRLCAFDLGTLGTWLGLYHIVGGVPTLIAGVTDMDSVDLDTTVGVDANLYTGFSGGFDTAHIPSGTGSSIGDNFETGVFVEDGTYQVPRLVGGISFYDTGTGIWRTELWSELNHTNHTVGVRGGGSLSNVGALCVAGGGSGGNTCGGGGGGGGVRFSPTPFTLTGTLTCTVGAGGVRGGSQTALGQNGFNSSIVGSALNLSCTGGGRGQGTNTTGDDAASRSGGSGGGGSSFRSGVGKEAGLGISGEGFDGGAGVGNSYVAASGGGAGGPGTNAPDGSPPVPGTAHGGPGKQWPSAAGGDDEYYGGGGGNGQYSTTGSNIPGNGGIGGGGRGGNRSSAYIAQSGTRRTGGAGGGGGHNDSAATGSWLAGSGGSGVIKFRSHNSNWSA